MSKTQNDKLREALLRKPMTALEIWRELGIARASARVYDLRNDGFDVQSVDIEVKNRDGSTSHVAQYSLKSPQRTLMTLHPGRGFTTAQTAQAVAA